MRKVLYLGLVVLMMGCKKDETSNQVPAPPANTPIKYTYSMNLVNDVNNYDGDTIRIRLNDVLILSDKTKALYSHPTRVKSGDVLSIYYNPGKVTYNALQVTDENDLKVYLDDKLFYEANCRCIVNVTKTIP